MAYIIDFELTACNESFVVISSVAQRSHHKAGRFPLSDQRWHAFCCYYSYSFRESGPDPISSELLEKEMATDGASRTWKNKQ